MSRSNPSSAASPGEIVCAIALVLLCMTQVVSGQTPAAGTSDGPKAETTTPRRATAEATGETTGTVEPTAAERYANVRRLLEADRARLVDLQEESKRLEEQFNKVGAEFSRLDGALQAAKVEAAAATNGEDRKAAQEKIAALEEEWKPTRDAFDVVIQHRRAVARQLETLAAKIALEETFLQQLSSPEGATLKPSMMDAVPPTDGATTPPGATPATTPAPATTPGATSAAPPATTTPATTPEPAPAGTGQTSATAPTVPPANATNGAAPSTPPAAANGSAASAPTAASATAGTAADGLLRRPATTETPDPELLDARREQQARQEAVERAKSRVTSIDQAIEVFERDQQATQDLFEAAQRQLDSAARTVEALVAKMQDRVEAGAPADELAQLESRRLDAEQQLEEARREVELQTARLNESNDALAQLKAVRAAAIEKVAEAEAALEPARSRVWYLESPITPGRLWRWALDVGPKILGILIVMSIAWYLAKLAASRQVMSFVLSARRGSTEERESRASTLRRVFENAAGIAILLIGTLAVLDQVGVNVTVLLGGAAVLGAAIAFGSQNLIKDFFSGFMILVENQYSVGNIVRIGSLSGTVEDISLRMTVLRDEEGVVHFIPHSQISIVSNMTYGWSRAVFNIRVANDQDVDQVMAVLMDLARQLRDDETFGPKMLGQPELAGVDEIGETHVTVKFLVKTRPLQQWSVKRELLRRIKRKFDQIGVRMPTPRVRVENRGLDSFAAQSDGTLENGVFSGRPNGKRDANGRDGNIRETRN